MGGGDNRIADGNAQLDAERSAHSSDAVRATLIGRKIALRIERSKDQRVLRAMIHAAKSERAHIERLHDAGGQAHRAQAIAS